MCPLTEYGRGVKVLWDEKALKHYRNKFNKDFKNDPHKKIFERTSAFSSDILNKIILCSEECPGHFQMLNSISGIYLLEAGSNTS